MAASRSFASSLFASRRPEEFAARQAARERRTSTLAGAAQSFLSPTLSGGQSQILRNISSVASLQGLFGGAVSGAIDRTRTQFLAGDRLSGLAGLADSFLNFAPRGVSAGFNARGPNAPGVLAQFLGLKNQFLFGGAGGQEAVQNLDPGAVGAFIGRRGGTGIRTSLAGIGTPGTGSNEIARRAAEGLGVADVGGFIRDNSSKVVRLVRAAALRGQSLTGQAVERTGIGGGQELSDTLRGFLRSMNPPKFGQRADLFPTGLQGLAASGLLPFGGAGGSTLPALFARRRESATASAENLFSPLLFRG